MRKLNLIYLRIWGCRITVRVPGNKRRKLDECGLEFIFINYENKSKNYGFYVIE